VGSQSPPVGRGLVDRAADERVPEAEASGHLGGAKEIELQELVDGVHRRRLGRSGRRRRELELEWIARDCRAFEHTASAVRQLGQLFAQRGGDGRCDPDAAERDLGNTGGPACAAEQPGELLEIERVTAALLEKDGCVGDVDRFAAEELSSLSRGQRGELNASQRPRAMRALEGGREVFRAFARAVRQRDQHGGGRRPAQQRADQLDGRCVGPVQIIEPEHERLSARQPVEQLAHGAVAAIALVLERQ
jgi:hypothetical protein